MENDHTVGASEPELHRRQRELQIIKRRLQDYMNDLSKHAFQLKQYRCSCGILAFPMRMRISWDLWKVWHEKYLLAVEVKAVEAELTQVLEEMERYHPLIISK